MPRRAHNTMRTTQPAVNAGERAETHSAVLLVARDVSLDESCRDTLSDAGVQCVVSVPDAQRALELVGEGDIFDAVVIGIGPGDVEAVKLAQHMSRNRADTPTVVVSPMGDLPIPGALVEDGATPGSAHKSARELLRGVIQKAVALRHSTRRQLPQ